MTCRPTVGKPPSNPVERRVEVTGTAGQQAGLHDLDALGRIDLEVEAVRVLGGRHREPHARRREPERRAEDHRPPEREFVAEAVDVLDGIRPRGGPGLLPGSALLGEAGFPVVQLQRLVAGERQHPPPRSPGRDHHPEHEVVGQPMQQRLEHVLAEEVQNGRRGGLARERSVRRGKFPLVTAHDLMDKTADLPLLGGASAARAVGAASQRGARAGEQHRFGDGLILPERGQDHGLTMAVAQREVDQGLAAHDRQRHQAVGLAVIAEEYRCVRGSIQLHRDLPYDRAVVTERNVLGPVGDPGA